MGSMKKKDEAIKIMVHLASLSKRSNDDYLNDGTI